MAKGHGAVDERAHEEEPAASGRDLEAESQLRPLELPPAAETIEPPGEQAPPEPTVPPAPEQPRASELPRAAGGGAGAVAALVVVTAEEGPAEDRSAAEPEASPIMVSAVSAAEEEEHPAEIRADEASPERSEPQSAEAAVEASPEQLIPGEASPAALADEQALSEPDPNPPPIAETAVAPAEEYAPEIRAGEPPPERSEPQPVEPALEAAPEGPAPEEAAPKNASPIAPMALADEQAHSEPDPNPPPIAPADDLVSEANKPYEVQSAVAQAPEPEALPPVPARAQPPLLELIPEVLPAAPKPLVLSPSVAPVLRPVQLEPVLHREPDARVVELVPRPPPPAPLQADAVPALRPIPGVPLPLPSPARPGLRRGHLRLVLRTALALFVATGALLLVLLVVYRWVDPPTSTLMLGQRLTGTSISQRWVPLERMSPNLSAAVISSEDGHFCRHHGVDWGELKEAIESAGDGIARGGSTISMQVVKNLFLWPSRSYVRKALEIPLAYAIEALWPKHRILEIYLNIAEWGPGIFGAEAAARYHFRKPALLLSPREAALLAVSLPNPFDRQAGRPGPGTLRLADNLLLRMKAAQANTACLRTAG